MRGVNSILETVKNYIGESVFGAVFIMCLIIILVYQKKQDKKYTATLILLSILVVFNSFSMKVVGIVTDGATYYRFLWAVPVIIVIAYAVTESIKRVGDKLVGLVIIGMFAAMMFVGGTGYINGNSIRYPGTTEKIPGDVKAICEIIEENKQEERPVCVFDLATQLMVRSEDASIVWGIGRRPYMFVMENGYDNDSGRYKRSENLIKVVNSGIKIQKRKLKNALKHKNIEFLVIKKEFQMTEYLEKAGVHPVGESDNYIIYQYIREMKE